MPNISEHTKVNLSFRNIVFLTTLIITLSGMYYSLEGQIQEAKLLPPPQNLEDVRVAIIQTTTELKFLRVEVEDLKKQITGIEQRLYDQKR
jgi:hypothetical protein